jgi:allantoinase
LSFELLIRGSVGLDGLPLELAITDGTIVAVGAELELDTLEEIDANGLTVMAGGIDPHVHFNEPGFRAEWEGWETGSAAAAAGGITTVVEMPLNAHPPTIDVESFDLKVAVASECSLIDFALWGGIVPGNLAAMSLASRRSCPRAAWMTSWPLTISRFTRRCERSRHSVCRLPYMLRAM